jgi:peptidoglycan pentaglycine glycine transferase (the first glycine)
MNSLEFFSFSDANKASWDDFVKQSPTGSIHQISDWKNFQEKIPGRGPDLGFGVRDKDSGEILATTFCVRMEMGMLGKFWWYSARGPVFDLKKNEAAGKFLIEHVAQELKKIGGVFWRFDPYFSSELQGLGVQTCLAIQNYQPTDTLEIDLTKSNETILAEMKRKGRYNINLAQRKGVNIVALENGKCTPQDLDDFWKLNNETTTRDKFSGHQKSYYKFLLEELKDYAVLFFAEYEGRRIATAISTFCADKAIYYFGASSSDGEVRNLMAPYLLQWEMMQYAKEKECKTYDFLGIAPEGVKKHAYSGISEFKWKFGGYRKTYISGKEIVLNSFWYIVYKLVKRLKG